MTRVTFSRTSDEPPPPLRGLSRDSRRQGVDRVAVDGPGSGPVRQAGRSGWPGRDDPRAGRAAAAVAPPDGGKLAFDATIDRLTIDGQAWRRVPKRGRRALGRAPARMPVVPGRGGKPSARRGRARDRRSRPGPARAPWLGDDRGRSRRGARRGNRLDGIRRVSDPGHGAARRQPRRGGPRRRRHSSPGPRAPTGPGNHGDDGANGVRRRGPVVAQLSAGRAPG